MDSPTAGEGGATLTVLSFRDPSGQVFRLGDKILRRVASGDSSWTAGFIASPFFTRGVEAGYFPATAPHPAPVQSEPGSLWLEHKRLDFPAYPHEWIPDQLYAAGQLTIRIALDAAATNLEVKDATPYNVLFDRGIPVFCDVLSFTPRRRSALWLPFAQFQRTFILPLYMYRRFGLPPHRLFLERRDGLEPGEVHRAISGLRRLKPFEFQAITLPALLANRGAAPSTDPQPAAEGPPTDRENFIFRRLLQKLRRQLGQVEPPHRTDSTWGRYEKECDHYSTTERDAKRDFVRRVIDAAKPRMVLDLGANAGEYSRIAAAAGAHVVAADVDINALQALYRRNAAEGLPITPVVLNLARPTPAVGWRNQEVGSFLDRARGCFDVVLGLALIHHLIVTERAPLEAVVELFAGLESAHVVIEWVDPSDPKFRQVAGANLPLYRDVSEARFRAALARHFRIEAEMQNSTGTRRLFWCSRAAG